MADVGGRNIADPEYFLETTSFCVNVIASGSIVFLSSFWEMTLSPSILHTGSVTALRKVSSSYVNTIITSYAKSQSFFLLMKCAHLFKCMCFLWVRLRMKILTDTELSQEYSTFVIVDYSPLNLRYIQNFLFLTPYPRSNIEYSYIPGSWYCNTPIMDKALIFTGIPLWFQVDT